MSHRKILLLGVPMKNVLFGLMMMTATTPAFASLPVAAVDNVSLDIARIELQNDGTLSVTLRATKSVVEKKIAATNFNILNSEASILSDAQVQTTVQPIRCMI